MRYLLYTIMGLSLVSMPLQARLTGFYVGGHAGLTLLKGQHKYVNGDTGTEGKLKLNSLGLTFGPNIGYLMAIGDGRIYVGAEAYASLMRPHGRKELQAVGLPVEGSVTIKTTRALGGALIIGTMMNPKVFMYARLGYEQQKYTFNYNNLTFQTPNSVNYTKTASGIAPGAGILYRFTEKWCVGAEYIFPILSKIALQKATDTTNGAKRGFEYAPSQHRLMVKLIYSFNGL